MQTKFKDGSVMVCGGCSKDAAVEYVGDDAKRVCKVGLAVGKRTPQDGGEPQTVWCNVVAWHGLAQVLATARKGNQVLVIGKLKSREYEGKTYTDLIADFVSVCSPPEKASEQEAKVGDPFAELEGDSGELPF